jgi:F-type H+-transporting ATPase subunit b
MATFLLLMAEASAVGGELAGSEAHAGFSLNTNVFDTNLINLAIIITVLVVFGRKILGKTLISRRENIETAIKQVEERANLAQQQLKEAQQKLEQAQTEAERIKLVATENAQTVRESILTQAAADIQRLREVGASDLNTELDKVKAKLRQIVVAEALQKVEVQLQAGLADDAQQVLIERSIAQLGGNR